jgi:transcriptional regulator with PAS, ATPase and Fis domain
MNRTRVTSLTDIVRAALTEVAGAVIVLDERLCIVDRTDVAEQIVGAKLETGVPVAKVLCGPGPERPVAEALAMGRPIAARVLRPSGGAGERVIHVRASPLVVEAERVGWLLLLEQESFPSEGPDAPIEAYGILTRDPAMKKLLRDVGKVARTTASVLVRGETGSGKELIARAVHAASPRASGPFRAINCAALPPSLLESELFGHVRGAFTGAVRDVKGHMVLANGGTLFLDEVAELPLELQAKLLRVLEERKVLPVGGRDAVAVDVRFVAATHRALRKEVEAGRFRADLMFRLRVVPLFLPPLRARRGDIELLAWMYIERKNRIQERQIARIAPGAKRALESYDWPGNVRELANAIEYAFVMGEGPVLTEAELPPEVRGEERDMAYSKPTSMLVPSDNPEGEPLSLEAQRLLHALERAHGNRQKAAAILGMSRVTLWRKLKALGLLDEDEKGKEPEPAEEEK